MSEDRPWGDHDRLIERYIHQDSSKQELASEWGCSEMTIYRALKKALSNTPYGYDCEECDETFPTDRGMRQHYGQVHDGSISGHPIRCTHCDVVERLPQCQIARSKNNFCSEQCRIDWMQEDGRVKTECAHCGEALSRPRWQVEASARQFCGYICHGSWKHESGPRGEDHPTYKPRDTVFCLHCGAKNNRRVSYPDVSNSFCNARCYGDWIMESGARRGDNHPAWDGGEFLYGEGWHEHKKELVRKRDGRQCRVCGKSEATHIEEHGQKHTVHHIAKARRLQDAPAELRNGAFNLVTMCTDHHLHEWEEMPVLLQFIAFLPHPSMPTEQTTFADLAADD